MRFGRSAHSVTIPLLLAGTVSAFVCGGGTDTPITLAPPLTPAPIVETVARIVVTPAPVSLQLGSTTTAQLSAVVTGHRGTTLTGRTVSWSSADPARVTVSMSGLVTAVTAGEATISATVEGVNSTAVVTVTPQAELTVAVNPVPALPLGLASQLTVTVRDAQGGLVTGRTITWTSSDTTIATVDADGVLVSRRSGSATITATTGAVRGQAAATVGAAPPVTSCALPNRTSSVGFGFPRASHRLRPTGTVRATVLFVDFSDAPAIRTPQNALDILQPAAPNFYAAVSYGALNFVLQPNLRWFRMSKPSTQYGWPNAVTFDAHRALLQEAADLAAATTDFSQTDLLVVVTNPDGGGITNGPALVPSPGGGVRVPGRTATIDNATNTGRDLMGWGGTWLNHETGHLMSLPDLYTYTPGASGPHLYVGEWGLMGLISGRAPEYFAFERWQLGWLANEQIVCVPTGTSLASLTPIENAGGLKAAMVPLSSTVAVVVESRRARGYDTRIPQPGPLVYFIDTSISSGAGTLRVLPLDDTGQVKLSRTLSVGGTITYQGASVTLVSRTDGTDLVRVTRP